jgi:hypothetical protein
MGPLAMQGQEGTIMNTVTHARQRDDQDHRVERYRVRNDSTLVGYVDFMCHNGKYYVNAHSASRPRSIRRSFGPGKAGQKAAWAFTVEVINFFRAQA